jgi:hypothetical protein
MQKTQDEINATIKFVKLCLKDARYSKELIAFLLSTYDLNEFIGTHQGTRYEIASGFLSHASLIFHASMNY